MKGTFQHIISIFLAFMVLLSTISWTVEKHFCMGRIMDVALFAGTEGCGMDDALLTMGDQKMDKHCCDDESFTVSGQDDLKLTKPDLELEQQWFVVAFVQSYLDLWVPLEELPIPNETYPPPLLTRDVQVLDQVFLI